MRINAVGWTGISRIRAATLARYAAKAWHNICITSL